VCEALPSKLPLSQTAPEPPNFTNGVAEDSTDAPAKRWAESLYTHSQSWAGSDRSKGPNVYEVVFEGVQSGRLALARPQKRLVGVGASQLEQRRGRAFGR
jgi:hypothetical protein